jgi:hypothetical protein
MLPPSGALLGGFLVANLQPVTAFFENPLNVRLEWDDPISHQEHFALY